MIHRQLARALCASAAIGAADAAGAQTLLDAKVEPASVLSGRPVTLTANFGNADSPNCGVCVHVGRWPADGHEDQPGQGRAAGRPAQLCQAGQLRR